jgi:hypothetical protein
MSMNELEHEKEKSIIEEKFKGTTLKSETNITDDKKFARFVLNAIEKLKLNDTADIQEEQAFLKVNRETIKDFCQPEFGWGKTPHDNKRTTSEGMVAYLLFKTTTYDLLNMDIAIAVCYDFDLKIIEFISLATYFLQDIRQHKFDNMITAIYQSMEREIRNKRSCGFVSFAILWKENVTNQRLWCYFEDTLVESRLVSWDHEVKDVKLMNGKRHEIQSLRQLFGNHRYGGTDFIIKPEPSFPFLQH